MVHSIIVIIIFLPIEGDIIQIIDVRSDSAKSTCLLCGRECEGCVFGGDTTTCTCTCTTTTTTTTTWRWTGWINDGRLLPTGIYHESHVESTEWVDRT
jgi:hypothetical protein